MSDQKLDAETEARIREVCGAISTFKPFTTWHPGEVHVLLAPFFRAAIKAEREAREQAGADAFMDAVVDAALSDPVSHECMVAIIGACNSWAAHADALAEALRTEVEMHSARYGREPDTCARCGFSYPCGFVQHSLPLLAAHDARRK